MKVSIDATTVLMNTGCIEKVLRASEQVSKSFFRVFLDQFNHALENSVVSYMLKASGYA